MTPELKTKWIDALRSGKYVQGNGHLCADNKYCCLGVLYEVMGGKWISDETSTVKLTKLRSATQLFDYDQELGISMEQMATLASLNDGPSNGAELPRSFNQIADYIEANIQSHPQES